MSVQTITAIEAIARIRDFGTIIDARSESEYAEDHLPGAVNWPSLNDEERKLVGTLYKQESPFEAQKRGAALVPFMLKGVADDADPTRLFQADRIHPREEAQPLILDNVWPELKKLLR